MSPAAAAAADRAAAATAEGAAGSVASFGHRLIAAACTAVE
ncbi:hypothetical protein [Streptomyces flavofungini]|nr:hypothetical protein [Streptomyces flavofungini]WJV44388.1 hypothetical protein QUY26_01865 [Streptomyces flavofungini]